MSHTTEAILAGTWGKKCPSCSEGGYDLLLVCDGRRMLMYSDAPTPARAKREIRQDYPSARIIKVVPHPKLAELSE